MIDRQGWSAALAGCALLLVTSAQAQATQPVSCERTRAEVRNECIEFLKTHRWDEPAGTYVLKSGVKPPEGVKTREEIRAERTAYLRTHRWNGTLAQWEPRVPKRELSQLSRAEVRQGTAAFARTHRWDDATASYVERKPK